MAHASWRRALLVAAAYAAADARRETRAVDARRETRLGDAPRNEARATDALRNDTTTIFVGGLPSSGTRVVVEALAALGVGGFGTLDWDSGVGCCAAVTKQLAPIVARMHAFPTSREDLGGRASREDLGGRTSREDVGGRTSREDVGGRVDIAAEISKTLETQLAAYVDGTRGDSRRKTTPDNGTNTLFVKEPELSLFLPWLVILRPRSTYVHVVRDGRDQALGKSSNWPLNAFRSLVAPNRPPHLQKLELWAKWNVATAKALAGLALPSTVVRLEDLRGDRAAATLRRIVATVLPAPAVAAALERIPAALDAVTYDLGSHGKLKNPGQRMGASQAVAKWKQSHLRFDDMDELSAAVLALYGYPATGYAGPTPAATSSPREDAPPWRNPVVVVPAHYKEWTTPPWADRLPPYASTYVYQRIDPKLPKYSLNVGYEAAVHIRFIVEHYDVLPNVTVFTHATPTEHNSQFFAWLKCLRTDSVEFTSMNSLFVRDRDLSGWRRAKKGAVVEQRTPASVRGSR